MSSPCAMLITPIWPKVRARPSAARSRIEPTLSPLNTWETRTSICRRLLGQFPGPVVAGEVGVGLNHAGGAPLGVDEAIRGDLADESGLGDVVVVPVDRD